MSVYEYKNSTWQEAETPKKYLNGAWEDTDGYVCENGVWRSAWSKVQPIYLVKDGVVQTAEISSLGGTITKNKMTYSSSDKCLSYNYSRSSSEYIPLRIEGLSTASISGKKFYLEVESPFVSSATSGGTYFIAKANGTVVLATSMTKHTANMTAYSYLELALKSYKTGGTMYVYNIWIE